MDEPLDPKSRQRLEEELLEKLRQRQAEWIKAPLDERAAARRSFMDALETFNRLVLYGKPPEKG